MSQKVACLINACQVKELEEKLEVLRRGVTLVSPEDRKAIEQIYSEKLSQWRKRKRMFKDIWDAITENSSKDLKEFKVRHFACPHFYPSSSYLLFYFCRKNLALSTMKMWA